MIVPQIPDSGKITCHLSIFSSCMGHRFNTRNFFNIDDDEYMNMSMYPC